MTNNFKDKERFWLYDPTILFDSEDIFNILPLPNLSDTQKLNAIAHNGNNLHLPTEHHLHLKTE